MRYFLFIVIFVVPLSSTAQEIKLHPNGLIYDDYTLNRLKRFADSVGLRYKQTSLSRDYYSLPQATCHYVLLNSGSVASAAKDIRNNISFDRFCKKYKTARVERNLLITKYFSVQHDDSPFIMFESIPLNEATDISFQHHDTALNSMSLNGKWIYQYIKSKNGHGPVLYAFFFTSDFQTYKLPLDYAKMIHYVDFMIDTSTRLYTGVKKGNRLILDDAGSWMNTDAALSFIYRLTRIDYQAPNEEVVKVLDSFFIQHPERKAGFLDKLSNGIKSAINQKKPNELLEFLAATYGMKIDALTLARMRQVSVACSEDNAPEIHTLRIAILAAETENWGVFMRAHFNLISDNMARMVDGSYARAERSTYIQEVESLNIEIPTILLGSCFAISNPSENRFVGKAQRIGKALSEGKDAKFAEHLMKRTMTDTSLDMYNRIIMNAAYRHFIYNIADKAKRLESLNNYREALSTFPVYYRDRLADCNALILGAGAEEKIK